MVFYFMQSCILTTVSLLVMAVCCCYSVPLNRRSATDVYGDYHPMADVRLADGVEAATLFTVSIEYSIILIAYIELYMQTFCASYA